MKKFTKKNLKEMKKNSTKLERKVINSLLNTGLNSEDLFLHIHDVCQWGCETVCVSDLIYYTDTEKFFNNNRKDILYLARQYFDWNVEENNYVLELKYGIVYRENQVKFTKEEKNYLSWFVYETICYYILTNFED
nr:MAG TPA: hypothetical protein [Caudoviricetes sp.]